MGKYLAIPLALLLAGCNSVLIQGEPNFNTAILLPDPTAAARNSVNLGLTPASVPTVCRDDSTADSQTVNACVYAVKAIIDDHYREYRITLHHVADDGNAAADMTVLGLTTAATGPISTVAKTILAGAGAFVSGSKSILNQDLLYKQTIEILINQMDTDRDTQFKTMLNEMSGTYTMRQAKDDLLVYFAAGTWDHAITSLQTAVAANQANCKAQTDAAKVTQAQLGGKGTPPGATPNDTAPPSTSATACPPTGAQPPPLTPAVAAVGKVFSALTGVGTFRVDKAATSTGLITVSFAPDGKTYSALQPMAFSLFAQYVSPVPIN